jgi:hypothetical protein
MKMISDDSQIFLLQPPPYYDTVTCGKKSSGYLEGGPMDVDAPQQPEGAAAGERPAPAAAPAAQPPRVPAATAASAVLPAVAHEDLEEEAAAERLIQPRENPLKIAARCMSKLPAVVRLALARASGSDVTNSQKCSLLF